MPPSAFSPRTPRWCASCATPLQGRADKKYCSPACRSMGHRHGLVEGTPLDWPARTEAAEQAAGALQAQLDGHAHAWQAAFPFEQAYDNLCLLLGIVVRDSEQVRAVGRYLEFVDQLLLYYQQHPGLVTGEVHAQRRLGHLQHLRLDMVTRQAFLQQQADRDQQRQVAEQEAARAAATTALNPAEA